MGKCYCDYCDVFLTNDSVAVRKQHNDGNRHKYNVCEYYRQHIGTKLQEEIDAIVEQFEVKVARGLIRPTYAAPVQLPAPVPVPAPVPAVEVGKEGEAEGKDSLGKGNEESGADGKERNMEDVEGRAKVSGDSLNGRDGKEEGKRGEKADEGCEEVASAGQETANKREEAVAESEATIKTGQEAMNEGEETAKAREEREESKKEEGTGIKAVEAAKEGDANRKGHASEHIETGSHEEG